MVSFYIFNGLFVEDDDARGENPIYFSVVDDQKINFDHLFFNLLVAELPVHLKHIIVQVSYQMVKEVALAVLTEISQQDLLLNGTP